MFKYLLNLLICLVLVVGCGTARKQGTHPVVPADGVRLVEKVKLYTQLLDSHRDLNGFIMTDKCDSTLFSGLLSAALRDVELTAARNGDQWFRRPGQDCGKEWGNSRSTISRDMILGVFYYMWYNEDLDSAIGLMEQLKGNVYILEGQGTPGELLMNPSYMKTLAHIILRLGGPRYSFELNLPSYFGKDTGFVAHLTVWHILLNGEINKEISNLDLEILKYHSERNPLNPLFLGAYHKYLDGDMTNVIQLLLNNKEWPQDKLPTTKEHCSAWPISRDYTERDWGPCNPEKEHTGAELVIIYHLLLKDHMKKEAENVKQDGPRRTSEPSRGPSRQNRDKT